MRAQGDMWERGEMRAESDILAPGGRDAEKGRHERDDTRARGQTLAQGATSSQGAETRMCLGHPLRHHAIQGWKFAHSLITHLLIRSNRSGQMSKCERFAQVAHYK